ncbi:MAG TPA: isoleucine--tRNA ligase [Trebonia sp.]|jgi:isoleucyl-tRNA synthetase|nr:isoleucine--tRNA ligase [Trebonia sp.]
MLDRVERKPGEPMPEVSAHVDLPAVEARMLERWSQDGTFAASLRQTEGRPRWTFYEGPPTANGMPGVHHIEARVFKDLFPRFKTMQGFRVDRKAGWDCHGLPVEVAVEKELGLSGKKDIEAYGVAEFNQRCRASVLRHVDAFTALTQRMGYWVDLSDAYRTMDPAYVESVWWALKTIYGKGLLVRDFRISPYCPRCGTPLSDHEMGQQDVYKEVTDPSVTVRFPLASAPAGASEHLAGASLLVWTTTPWTLVSNTAVAVHPEVEYVVAREAASGDKAVVAAARRESVLGEGWDVLATVTGADLLGATYERPFALVEIPDAHRVVAGHFVTTEDGTGLVHLAPAFGADDMEVSRANGMPVVNPVRPDGRFEEHLPIVGGLFFKDADAPLSADLESRGLLFRSEMHAHSYPHCWRCKTVLLYYALPSWYIRTTAIKDQLLAENAKTNWQPPNIKDGRYGEWLRNNVDWALSRTRYWGTPLPIWECAEGHFTCVGSLAELGQLAGTGLSALDPHRPFVDDVTFGCPDCGALARRVPEVIDAWFDSGSMPFAQHGAPLRNAETFEQAYPAKFICEAIDQTRGWFYSLMAVGTLLFGRSSYENVVCLGHVVDEQGRKMSKHLGNVMEPLALMEAHSADAVRWFFAASGSPWASRRVGPSVLDEVVRKVLLTYWNTVSFLVLYANAAASGPAGSAAGSTAGTGAWTPESAGSAPPPAQRPLLDRWLMSEAHACVRDVTAALEAFDTVTAGRRLSGLIDDLSNWYVRRSRRRFWEGPASADGASAFATLHAALLAITKLMAPITPFLADHAWSVLRPADEAESVHLSSWPAADPALIDEALSSQMAQVRRLVDLGRSARSAAGVRTRQPLSRALVNSAQVASLPDELRALVADELNVREVLPLAAANLGSLVTYTVKPQFRALGRRFGGSTKAVAAAITAAEPAELARAVAAGPVSLAVPALGTVELTGDDVIVTQTPLEGWGVATAGGETVALDLAMSPELLSAGWSREVIRFIQDVRKGSGLDVTDRIAVRWSAADPDVAAAVTEHAAAIAADVLAVEFEPAPAGGQPPAGGEAGRGRAWREHEDAGSGFRLWLSAAAGE